MKKNRSLLISKVVAEFIGTWALVFFGCGAVATAASVSGSFAPGGVPVVFGLVITVMIYALGHISGAHFNPAVTIAFASVGGFPWRQVPAYIGGQCAGAVSGALVLKLLFGGGAVLGATTPQIDPSLALAWEFILTFFLMFVIFSVATDSRAEGTMAGLSIGATVAICAFIGGPFTGASMNPARTIGPAIVTGEFSHLWVYFLGPIPAAALAVWAYGRIQCEKDEEGNNASGCC